jgi:hypothetical protein
VHLLCTIVQCIKLAVDLGVTLGAKGPEAAVVRQSTVPTVGGVSQVGARGVKLRRV